MKSKKDKEAILSVFYDYDLTGGGLPFGHVRVLHVELKIDDETIVRNRYSGEELKNFVEKSGTPQGKKESFPYDKDYSSQSYKRKYLLPSSLTVAKIEKAVLEE